MATSQAIPDVPNITDLKIGKEIGRGSYGVIFKGEWQGSPCAIKEVHEIFMSEVGAVERERTRIAFQKECEQSIRLRHPNIVQFFGLCACEPKNGNEEIIFSRLVMELLYCSLNHLLEPKDKEPLPMPIELKLSLLCDIARGLRYLHSHTPAIVHRDLSTNNVLVSADMVAKVGDLGTVRFIDPKRQSQRLSKAPGTAVFMPAEALVDNPVYGTDIDVFSFACVTLHTLSGKWPTPSQPTLTIPDSNNLLAVSEADRRAQYLNEVKDENVKELVVRCLNNERKKRPDIKEVCEKMDEILSKFPSPFPITKLHAYIKTQEHLDHIKQLENDVTIRDTRIDEMQKMITEKEAEIDARNTEITAKDSNIQQKDAEIEKQATEIGTLNTDIRNKDQEIERRGQQIAEQQATINELSAKLPSQDLIQRDEKSTNYWQGLKTTWSKIADLPVKMISCCAVEMDGDVYVSGRNQFTHFINVLRYSQANDGWSILPHLPCTHSSLAVVCSKSQLIAVGGVYADSGDDLNLEADISTTVLGKVLTWDAQIDSWVNAYPDMPTARCSATVVGHDSAVIVAGGVTSWEPTVTNTPIVEVMAVNDAPHRSEWSVVQSLPYPSSFAIPLMVNDMLYITSGYYGDKTTCGILTVPISKLLASKKEDTVPVWERVSDLPHDSLSISDYDGHLVVFGGRRKSGTLEDGQLQYKMVSPIHLYNMETDTWDYVGHVPEEYRYWLGCAVHLEQSKILFVGGASDPNETSYEAYLSTCALLTIAK